MSTSKRMKFKDLTLEHKRSWEKRIEQEYAHGVTGLMSNDNLAEALAHLEGWLARKCAITGVKVEKPSLHVEARNWGMEYALAVKFNGQPGGKWSYARLAYELLNRCDGYEQEIKSLKRSITYAHSLRHRAENLIQELYLNQRLSEPEAKIVESEFSHLIPHEDDHD